MAHDEHLADEHPADEHLADRIRAAAACEPDIDERQMSGGWAPLVGGHGQQGSR
jgi:hypothetical protein